MNEEIKNCPFCGEEGDLGSNYSWKNHCYFVFVKCEFCGATGKTFGSRVDPAEYDWDTKECSMAVAAWNKRV